MIDVNLDLEDIGFCFNFSQWSADVENDLYEMPHAETQNPIKTPYFLALSKSVNGISQNMRKFSFLVFPILIKCMWWFGVDFSFMLQFPNQSNHTCYLALSKQVENCTLTSTYKSILLSYVNKRDSSLFNKSLLAITIYCLESRKFVGLSSVTYKSPYPSIFVEKDAYHTFNKRRHQSTEALEACLN